MTTIAQLEAPAASLSPIPTAPKPSGMNPDQQAAIDSLVAFLVDPNPPSYFFVLKGFAGTGKTYLMQEVVRHFSKSRAKFAYTAPTNKAAKELRKRTGEACTIFSLLGLRIEKNGELKELTHGKGGVDLSELNAVFLDEAGMVNKRLMELLIEQTKRFELKVVFMGDIAQLPPVGEAESPVWKLPHDVALTKVMRHDNAILALATELRERMNDFTPSIAINTDNDGIEGVWKMPAAQFKKAIYEAAANGKFADGDKCKVIAWRNTRVDEYNNLVRLAIFGAHAQPGHYVVGERVIATAPLKRGEDLLMTTDEEAVVESVIETTHPLRKEYKALELRCVTEQNKQVRLLVIHPDSLLSFTNDCTKLAHEAKLNGKLWKKFWDLKETFHELKYAYAITAHRAQGSTYETVYVDYQDILFNRNRKEAFQCLYVACTRATTKLVLA